MGALGFNGNPHGVFVVGFSIAVAVLDTLAVALRFLARHRSKASFAADDWWILGSLIPLYLMIGVGGAGAGPNTPDDGIVLIIRVAQLPQSGAWEEAFTIFLHRKSQLSSRSCIAGAIRIVYLSDLQKVDLTKSLANEYLWSQIEPATAIICACAVTYRPLFRKTSPSIPKKLSSILSFGRRGGSLGTHDDAESQRRLQYEWPAADGLAAPMTYQEMHAKVTKHGAHVVETRQDPFGTRTTYEAATPYIPLSRLKPGQ
ncbi:MAG: hypothetical protein Q9207_004050 [Kuettlingeria erythrocarpa]